MELLRELGIGEITQNGTAILVGQERVEASAIVLVQRSCLKDAAQGIGVLAYLGNNTTRKDKVMVDLVEQDGDEVVPVGGRATICTIVPGRPAVHSDEDVVGTVATFAFVEITTADGLGSSDGENGFEEVCKLDKVGATTFGEIILLAQVSEDNLNRDNNGRYPGLLDYLLAPGNDWVDGDSGRDIMNVDFEEGAMVLTPLWWEGVSAGGGA